MQPPNGRFPSASRPISGGRFYREENRVVVGSPGVVVRHYVGPSDGETRQYVVADAHARIATPVRGQNADRVITVRPLHLASNSSYEVQRQVDDRVNSPKSGIHSAHSSEKGMFPGSPHGSKILHRGTADPTIPPSPPPLAKSHVNEIMSTNSISHMSRIERQLPSFQMIEVSTVKLIRSLGKGSFGEVTPVYLHHLVSIVHHAI